MVDMSDDADALSTLLEARWIWLEVGSDADTIEVGMTELLELYVDVTPTLELSLRGGRAEESAGAAHKSETKVKSSADLILTLVRM